MQNFLYDEKEMAGRIYENGFTNGYDRREAILLAKYFRHVLGYGDIRIKKKLIDFCSNDRYFNPVTEASRIKSYVKNSKYDFVINSSVFITKREIDDIRKVKNFDAQKTYLSLIVIARRNGYTNVPIKNITEIKKIAGLNCTNNEVSNLYNILYLQGFIYPIVVDKKDRTIGFQKILNMDFEDQPEIIFHNDKELYELGKIYERYCGGYLLWCEECGVEFTRKSKNSFSKYCDKHSEEKRILKYKKYNKKRNNSTTEVSRF